MYFSRYETINPSSTDKLQSVKGHPETKLANVHLSMQRRQYGMFTNHCDVKGCINNSPIYQVLLYFIHMCIRLTLNENFSTFVTMIIVLFIIHWYLHSIFILFVFTYLFMLFSYVIMIIKMC